MPNASELTRLTALLNRLIPLADVKRGDLITADNWNQLVGTLIEVSQIVLAEGANNSVLPHEHQDEVKLAWLEPQLRQLIQAGPLSDPASKSALTNVERAVERLRERLIQTDQDLSSLRKRLDEVRTLDLQRENEVIGIRRSVDGLADARKDVFDLRASLDTIKTGVAVALEASDKFTVDNEIVDFTVLLDRVNSVEELFQNLKLADGTLLDAKVFDNRLAEFANKFIDEDELREALEGRSIEIPESAISGLRDELEGSVLAASREEWTTAINNLDGRIRDWADAEIAQRVAPIDKRSRNNQTAVNEAIGPTSGFNRQQLDYMVKFFGEQFGDEFTPPKRLLGVTRVGGLSEEPVVAGSRTASIAEDELHKTIAEATRVQVEEMLPAAVSAAVNTAVAVSVSNAVETSVKAAVDSALNSRLNSAVNAAVSSSVNTAVNAAISNSLNKAVNSAVERSVGMAVENAMQDSMKTMSGQMRELVQVEVKRQVAEGGSEARNDSRSREVRRDDLTKISGLGDSLVKRLNTSGITSFEQLAESDPREIAKILRRSLIDSQRIVRDAKRLI